MDSWNNITGFMDLMQIVDEKILERSAVLSVGIALLIMIYAIAFMSTKRMGADTAFAFSTFMGFLTSFFLLFIGFINMGVFVFSSILLFISMVFLIYKKRERRG